MYNCKIGCFLLIGLGLASAFAAQVYVIVHNKCDLDAVKAAVAGVIGCLVVSLFQAISACFSVNRSERGIMFAFSKISLVAAVLFFCSAILINDCVKKYFSQFDDNPLSQPAIFQVLAVCLASISVILGCVAIVFYICKNENRDTLELVSSRL